MFPDKNVRQIGQGVQSRVIIGHAKSQTEITTLYLYKRQLFNQCLLF